MGARRGDRQAARGEGFDIVDVVADEADLLERERVPRREVVERRRLVLAVAVDVGDVQFGRELLEERAALTRDEGEGKTGAPPERDPHHVEERDALRLLTVSIKPHGVVGQHAVDVHRDGLDRSHQSPTRRSRSMIGISVGMTVLAPSPSAASTSRMSRTSRMRPLGSSDAAWSDPHIALSSVM